MSEGADRRLHPGTILLRFVKEAPQTLLALPAALAFSSRSGLTGALYLAAVLAVVLLVAKWLVWRRFRYGVGAAEIVIESGIFNRNRRSIPFDRVQDVDIEQDLPRPVVRPRQGADRDRRRRQGRGPARQRHRWPRPIASGKRSAPAGAAPRPAARRKRARLRPGRPLFAMDPPRLVLFGLFNFSLVYIAGLFALLQTFDGFLPFDIYDPARWVGLVDDYLPVRWTFGAIAAVLLVAALLGTAAGVLRTLARDYGFRLSLEGGRFRRERGLFTRSEAVISSRRVQLAEISGGPVRGLFGWSGLSFQTLGAGTDRGGHQDAAPFATRSEIGTILAHVPPLRLPPPPEMARVSKRHILRSVAGRLVPALAAILALSYWQPLAIALLALLPLLAVVAALERHYHRYALAERSALRLPRSLEAAALAGAGGEHPVAGPQPKPAPAPPRPRHPCRRHGRGFASPPDPDRRPERRVRRNGSRRRFRAGCAPKRHFDAGLSRHCERSEAIRCCLRGPLDCFVASLSAMTGDQASGRKSGTER